MSVNPFDQACRYLARRSGAALLSWLLTLSLAAFRFVRWLDTRLTVPGLVERIGDTIAHLERLDQDGLPWAVPLEFQVEPDPLMFGRLLVYEGMAWLLEKPSPLPGDRFQLQAVVVNLTGTGTILEPIEWNLQTEDAAAVLEQVAAGLAPRAVLVWIPLMRRGSEAPIIQRWLELAEQETDPHWKADLALVRVFAELVGQQDVWNRALEGFNVQQSAVVNEWKAEARVEAKAEALRDVLEARFGSLPAEMAAKIVEAREAESLNRWLVFAARAATLDQFRQEAGL